MPLAGMNYLPHDKTFFGDRLIVPNRLNYLWGTAIPPLSVWSASMFDVDFISVGSRDDSLSESIRQFITNLPFADNLFQDGANDFIKMGYMDIQGWLIAENVPLTKDLTATPNQLIDDYIRKVPVPVLNDGDQLTPDEQLQTVAETVGPDSNVSEEGEDQLVNENLEGFATKHPAVIDQAAWYDLGPQMFYEQRIYLGHRHGNAVSVAEQKQRYAAAIRTKIGGKATRGRYAAIIFTVSMPHLHAGGNVGDATNDVDYADEPISPYTSWEDMIMTYQRAPLEHFEMQDEISLANARFRFRQDMQDWTGLDGSPITGQPTPSSEAMGSLWGITGNYDKYIAEKRAYNVLQGTWEQKPMLASIRINHTINAPFMLVPERM